MVQRISVDMNECEMIARIWNSSAGRSAQSIGLESGDVSVVCHLRMQDFSNDEQRSEIARAIQAAAGNVEAVEFVSEVRVPEPLDGRAWRLLLGSHLRADRVSLDTEQAGGA